MFTRSTILDFTGKKLALWFIAHDLQLGTTPLLYLASTSHPPDIIHGTGVPRFSPFLTVFRLRVLY